MALDDIYRVVHTQRYSPTGPLSINVYYYEQTLPGDPEGAETLANLFDFYIVDGMKAFQNVTVGNVSLEVANIVPSADYHILVYDPVTNIGSRIGHCLPPYVCWAFRLNRTTTASRNGQKRYMGVSEGDQVNGVPEGSMATIFDTFEAVLGAPLPSGAPNTTAYTPRIFRAGKPEVTIPAKTIPAVAQAIFPMGDAQFVSISSQNTRKFNVGI